MFDYGRALHVCMSFLAKAWLVVFSLLIFMTQAQAEGTANTNHARREVAVQTHLQTLRTLGCIKHASVQSRLPEPLLLAIAMHESSINSVATNRNKNGSLDVGVMQINSIHWPRIIEMGGQPKDLLDPCINVMMGALLLKEQVDQFGLNAYAIGRYHSATPEYRDRYARAVCNMLQGTRIC